MCCLGDVDFFDDRHLWTLSTITSWISPIVSGGVQSGLALDSTACGVDRHSTNSWVSIKKSKND
jgi:hypothetical protein